MISLGRYFVLDVPIDAVDYEDAAKSILDAATREKPMAVTALAVHGVMTGFDSPAHRSRLKAFDLIVPDGQPVRWALRWLHGIVLPDRVYGPELMMRVCAGAAERQLPIYLYGSDSSTLRGLVDNLQDRFPNLEVAGYRESLFRRATPEEYRAAQEAIIASGARIVFVGLGCPRQEIWTYENARLLGIPTVAVGAAFSFHAGLLRQAPEFLQKRGLEWAYRLWTEPRRLWRRYLVLNPRYLKAVLWQSRGRLRSIDHEGDIPLERFA